MGVAHSPLRYPGGKAALLDLTAAVLRLNDIERSHYVEPYAGGCGLALELLLGGHVSDIHINDIDVSVWAFWHCVLNHTDSLVELIESTPVTVREWKRQREIYINADARDWLTKGFAAFFLNRTNRSGVIKAAGVIGGLKQTGNYKIDCRFNREDLTRRVRRIAKYRGRIHLTNLDALKFLTRCEKRLPRDAFLFIDPPYYQKGAKLYANFYTHDDHLALANRIMESDRHWMVTYDDTPEIRRMYRERRQYQLSINYSLHEKRVGTELLIASKGIRMPDEARQRQVNRPQYRAA